MSDDDYLYRPPYPLAPRRPWYARLPAWAWGVLLLAGAAVLQLTAALCLFLVYGPRRNDSPPLCQSNLHRLSQALNSYAQDFDGMLPPPATWMDSIRSRTPSDAVFRCPFVQQTDIFSYGYAFNSTLGWERLSEVKDPAGTPLVYDSSRMRRNANDAVTSLPNPPRHRGRAPGMDGMMWGNNIAFLDGHAALTPIWE